MLQADAGWRELWPRPRAAGHGLTGAVAEGHAAPYRTVSAALLSLHHPFPATFQGVFERYPETW